MSVDLHIHTNASDGTLDPVQVVSMAVEAGLKTIALADHETTAGYAPAFSAAQKVGLTVLPAVELLTYYQNVEVHLLGYFPTPDDQYLQKQLAELRYQRSLCTKLTVEKLMDFGFKIDWDDVIKNTEPDIALSKGHVMRALHKAGYIQNRDDAMNFLNKYLDRDGLAYVVHEFSFADGVRLITGAGGLPVLAHPGLIRDDDIVNELCTQGIAGIEVFYNYFGPHREEYIQTYNSLAAEKKLLKTGGSDYHGNISAVKLGCQYVPFEEVKDFLRLFGIE